MVIKKALIDPAAPSFPANRLHVSPSYYRLIHEQLKDILDTNKK